MLYTILAAVLTLAAAEPPADEGAAAPAATSDTAAASAPVAPAKPPKKPKRPRNDPDRVVCEDATPVGSMISQQVCATNAEWERRRQHDVEELSRNRDATRRAGGE